ncbi:TolC family protein [Glaciecola sp. XM2]|uniref:TolC family protein n=1 Tax=Glaciecola sp. XM2 TaxID=1914931 RepID=UPI001BDE7929|nr:TolC family protein [Glaciecola sp. XM2]
MKKLLATMGQAAALLVLSMSVNAEQGSIQLHEVLDATLEHQLENVSALMEEAAPADQRLSWMDGVPSVSVLYLHDQTTDGTREGEINFSVPIKSAIKKQAEQNLMSNSAVIKASAQRQLALYYSGLIRDLIWDLQTQMALRGAEKRKNAVLVNLVEQYSKLTELNAMPKYALYLLQKELSGSNILALQYERQTQQLMSQYYALTGLRVLPTVNEEDLPELKNNALAQHPDIQALDAAWAAYDLALNGQRKSAQPWSIQLTARRIEAFDFSENQIGVGVDVPISMGNELSATQRSEYMHQRMQYEIERNKLLVQILASTTASQTEYDFLLEKQTMLDESIVILNALEKSINELLSSNTQDQAIVLRNLIDLIDAKNEIELNRIAIKRQIANIRQTSGLSL